MDVPHKGFSPWKRFLLTASLLISWSLPGAAQLAIIPQPSIAVVGEDVLLSVHGLQEESYIIVTWFQGIDFLKSILSYDTRTQILSPDPAFTDWETLQPSGSFLFKGVELTDSGNYTILVEGKDSGQIYATGDFQVYVKSSKPNLILKPSDPIIEFQRLVTFTCSSQDVGVSIQWFLNNTELPPNQHLSLSSDNKSLTFNYVTREDSRYYQCEARTPRNSQRSDGINLIVNCCAHARQWVHLGQHHWVEVNSNLTLECQADSNLVPSYTWYLNESHLVTSGTNYYISRASRNDDGSYKCMAENGITLISISASITIKVTERVTKPYVLANITSTVENEGVVNFSCDSADVEIGVYWLLDNQNLLLSDRLVLSEGNWTLTIVQPQREDAGQYQCITWNLVSTESSDPVTLTVNYGSDPINITQEFESSVVNGIEAKLHSTLMLLCRAHSHPAAQYHWSFNSTSPLKQDGPLLILWAVTWFHQGTYMCSAWNNLTQLSCSATVTIMVVVSSLSAGAIAGTVIGILAAVALTAGLVYLLVIRKRYRGTWKKSMEDKREGETLPEIKTGQSESVFIDALGPQRPITSAKVPQEDLIYMNNIVERPNDKDLRGPVLFPPYTRDPLDHFYETLSEPYENDYCTINPTT